MKMSDNKQALQVAALKNGTVIDHIPSDKLFTVVALLGLQDSDSNITIGNNFESKKLGKKGIIKVADRLRKGCDKSLLDTIVKMSPARVVYVSCDSATLARDLKYLCERGYEVVSGQGVDQFPMSVHVECVCLMTRTGK